MVLEFELADRRQIQHGHREDRRRDAVRFDEVLGALVEVKQHALVEGRVGAGDKRNLLKRRVGRRAGHERRVLRREPHELRAHRLIRSARHLRVPRPHLDAVRARLLGGPRDHEQRGHALAQVRRAEHEEQGGGHGNCAEGQDVAFGRLTIDRVPFLHFAALRDGLVNELLDQMRRVVLCDCRIRRRFDRAQDGGFERRIVLFQVHRDLAVRHLAADHAGQELPDQKHEHGDCREPERDDGRRAESECLEARGRQEQRQKGSRQHHHRAADGQAQAPAVSHRSDDLEQLAATVHWEPSKERLEVGGWRLGPRDSGRSAPIYSEPLTSNLYPLHNEKLTGIFRPATADSIRRFRRPGGTSPSAGDTTTAPAASLHL